ncbi:Helix-turn-helix protein [Clostridium neonatale]|uniref:helix-turn-helix domain-containing protein n=1 Tax=Clostridium neonatale TaxID=137838 RepID=UPI001DDE1584|nr:helix-turn-helix transcriptional regulator [Clostridium neonatale]CAG9702674.1 Helix-turn-helix protein [Clostridium neonatale]
MYPKFAKLLQKNKVTAYRVAKDTEIPTSTLSDWKVGRSKPKIDKLQKIAEYFNVPITYFIEERKEENE